MTNRKKKAAFTLAEVLITLGIIGIVAAMTLPMLIAKYQKLVATTQLKRIYSILANAEMLAISDYGDRKNWDYPISGRVHIHRLQFLILISLKNITNHILKLQVQEKEHRLGTIKYIITMEWTHTWGAEQSSKHSSDNLMKAVL